MCARDIEINRMFTQKEVKLKWLQLLTSSNFKEIGEKLQKSSSFIIKEWLDTNNPLC